MSTLFGNQTQVTGVYNQSCSGTPSVQPVHWPPTTFVAALRRDELTAPIAVDVSLGRELFLAWTKQFYALLCGRRHASECANYFASSGYVST